MLIRHAPCVRLIAKQTVLLSSLPDVLFDTVNHTPGDGVAAAFLILACASKRGEGSHAAVKTNRGMPTLATHYILWKNGFFAPFCPRERRFRPRSPGRRKAA